MVFLIKKIKVLNSVIKCIAVYMMHFFILLKLATKLLLHKKTMFGNLSITTNNIAVGFPLPICVFSNSSFISRVVFALKVSRFSTQFRLATSATSIFRFLTIISDLKNAITYYTVFIYQATHNKYHSIYASRCQAGISPRGLRQETC